MSDRKLAKSVVFIDVLRLFDWVTYNFEKQVSTCQDDSDTGGCRLEDCKVTSSSLLVTVTFLKVNLNILYRNTINDDRFHCFMNTSM